MSGPNHPRSPSDMKPDPDMSMGGFGLSYGASKAQPPSPEGLTSSSIVSLLSFKPKRTNIEHRYRSIEISVVEFVNEVVC